MMKRLSKSLKNLSIRNKILMITVVPLVTTVVILGEITFVNGKKAVEDMTQRLGYKSTLIIQGQVLNFLKSHTIYLQSQVAALESGEINFNNQKELEKYLWQQVKRQSLIQQVFYFNNNQNGEFTLVNQNFEGNKIVSKYRNDTIKSYVEVYTLDQQGNRIEVIEREKYGDPRTRPWYKVALEAKSIDWTPIYQYAGEPQLGISGVAPIYNAEGNKIQGVFAIDITLSSLDKFLDSLEISPSGEAFIIERSGALVASSTSEPLIVNNKLVPISKSQSPILAATASFLLNKFGKFENIKDGNLTFNFNNEEQLVEVKKISDSQGLDWLLIVVIPRLDFMGNINAMALSTVSLGIIITVVIAFISSALAAKITQPIKKLTKASQLIAQGNLNQQVPVESFDEVGILATSFNHMTKQLNQLIDKEVQLESIQKQLEIGRQIQHDFLPEVIPDAPGWQIQKFFQPAYEVAGDFYDTFLMNKNRHLCFIVGDVCDKGIGAALFMSLFRSLLRGTAFQFQESPQLALQTAMDTTNNYVANNHSRTNMFATIFFGILDLETGELNYINGGHEAAIIISPSNDKTFLKSTGPAVGLFAGAPYKILQTQLKDGDTLVTFTDGVIDARCPEGQAFKQERLLKFLDQGYDSAYELIEMLASQLNDYIQTAKQFDDITLLALRKVKA